MRTFCVLLAAVGLTLAGGVPAAQAQAPVTGPLLAGTYTGVSASGSRTHQLEPTTPRYLLYTAPGERELSLTISGERSAACGFVGMTLYGGDDLYLGEAESAGGPVTIRFHTRADGGAYSLVAGGPAGCGYTLGVGPADALTVVPPAAGTDIVPSTACVKQANAAPASQRVSSLTKRRMVVRVRMRAIDPACPVRRYVVLQGYASSYDANTRGAADAPPDFAVGVTSAAERFVPPQGARFTYTLRVTARHELGRDCHAKPSRDRHGHVVRLVNAVGSQVVVQAMRAFTPSLYDYEADLASGFELLDTQVYGLHQSSYFKRAEVRNPACRPAGAGS